MIDFTHYETAYLDKITSGWAPYSYDLYLSMIENIIQNQFTKGMHLLDSKVDTLLSGIQFKIMDYRAGAEIEKMLEDPTYSPRSVSKTSSQLSTKAQSLAKVFNVGELHQAILDQLNLEPGLSRNDLAARTGISLQSVTPRICELKKAGYVVEIGTKYDSNTDRMVTTLKACK